jgi:hypothetical protein
MSSHALHRAVGKSRLAKPLLIALAAAVPWVALHGIVRAESFVLTGLVLLSERGDGIAYLVEPSITKNQVVAVRRGDTIGPYRLTRIADDRVELEGPSGTVVIPVRGGGTAVAGGRDAGPASREAVKPRAEQATGTAPRVPVTASRSERTHRTPFAELMRERVRALRSNPDSRAAREGSDEQTAGDKDGKDAAKTAGAGTVVRGRRQGAPASATLTDLIRPPVGPSTTTPRDAASLLAPLLGPR